MKKLLIPIIIVCSIPLLSSCLDSNYDLSDINTTARFRVNDLVVPVNLDAITLDCALDLNDSSRVKKCGDEYAIIEEGEFSSNAIEVKSFTADGGEYDSQMSIDLINDPIYITSPARRVRANAVRLAHADIPNNSAEVKASTDDADPSVVSISRIGTEMNVKLSLKFDGLTRYIRSIDIEDLEMQFIKGLEMETNLGSYNPETGKLTIGDTQTNTNHEVEVYIHVTGIDAEKAGIIFHKGTFGINDEARVTKGLLAVYDDQLIDSKPVELPPSVGYTLTATVGNCAVTTFSGKLRYDITGIDIAPIDMGNIPEMFTQEGTNVILDNPQIYLALNNPLRQAGYGLTAQAGVSITGNDTYSTANNAIVLDKVDNSLLISPYVPKTLYDGFENAKHVPFADLGKVVSGGAFPQQIGIDIVSPMIPTQQINNFKLGTTLPAVHGRWLFYAPLSLTESSLIKFTKTWDDWQSEDLDGLTVENGELTATFSSDVPLSLDITFILLGAEGELTGKATLPANAKDVDLAIPLTGSEVSKIYGLTIDARINGDGKTLSPSQQITVKNLKAKLNGYYDREL